MLFLDDEAFWRFAYERQRIWHARHVLREEPPWTTDPVLRDYRICNVQRELDTGTQHLFRTLEAVRWRDWEPVALVRCLMTQRYFNQPDVEWHPSREAMIDSVRRRLERTGPGVFARTWMTNGSSWRAREVGFRTQLLEDYAAWDPAAVLAAITLAPGGSLRPVFEALVRQGCIGQVIGWQIALDMPYAFRGLSDDVWVPEMRIITRSRVHSGGNGHGPATSTALVAPGATSFRAVVTELRDRQGERLARRGLDWAAVAWEHKPRLTLADIEHTLCEWARYRALSDGRSRRRRFPDGAGYYPRATVAGTLPA